MGEAMQSSPMPETLPKATTFACLGALLSLGAPLGLLLVRSVAAREGPSLDFIGAQIKSDPVLYGYLTFATLAMFVLLGRLLGAREDELARTSITDPLTRLHNRRHVRERVEQELARSQRHGRTFSLLLIDVDHLKDINDRGGHEAGDRALLGVSDALRKTCRVSDLAARYGGDEFVALLPSTNAEQAIVLCERLRHVLSQTSVKLPIPLTVSIGVAESTSQTTSADALFEAADAALYEAKQAGRDRVTLADGIPKEP